MKTFLVAAFLCGVVSTESLAQAVPFESTRSSGEATQPAALITPSPKSPL